MPNRYISVDFETANAKRVSACSIGVAVIEDGHVVEIFSSLIKPPSAYSTFAPINVRIHGITSDMVENAPTFDVLYPRLRQIAAGAPILGYSKFDRSVLQNLADFYELPISHNRINCYVDVCSLALKQLPQLKNHKLVTLADYFELGDFSHHDASDDAVVCALVFLALNGYDVSAQKDCAAITRRTLDLKTADDAVSLCYGDDEEGRDVSVEAGADIIEKPSTVEIASAFNEFAASILEDDVVDYKEAIELRCFLSAIPRTKGVSLLGKVVDDFLDDDVIDSGESEKLCELILDVSAELMGRPIAKCQRCGGPIRGERVERIVKCPWCEASITA